MTWLLDGRRFARKVKNATETIGSEGDISQNCKQSRCQTCGSALQNYWPGFPAGVKFDPSDKELIDHLAAKIGVNGLVAHPFLDEFIPTLDAEDGICYRHPEKLPGIKLDGSSSHFFHRPANAYTTGNRKRRKIHCENANRGETRWHKTGKTRPVIENGKQIGCKKIMVLYTNFGKNVKPNKTCWVMHQYHLGTAEDEKDGELVVSKVFFQTQPRQSRKDEECGNEVEESRLNIQDEASNLGAKGMPVTPQTSPPVRPVRTEPGHDELTSFELANGFHNQGDPEKFNVQSYGNAGQSLPDHGSNFSIQAHGSTENCIPDNRGTAIACGQPELNAEYASFNAGSGFATFLQPISTDCPAPLDSAAVNVGIQVAEGATLECSTVIPAWAGESQLPDGQEAELDADFLCHETLICDPMANSSSAPMEDFRKFAADIGFLFDGVTGGEFAVDNIDVDTPPGFLQDIAALWPKSQSQSNQI